MRDKMDSEYWKRIYQNKWSDGKRRAELVKGLIEIWGFTVDPFGFVPTSTEYFTKSPDEKGKPDWQIIVTDKIKIPLEVTGTKYSRGADDIWIRNDKFEYAENHPELECWVAHVLENKELIRYVKLESKEKFPLRKIQEGSAYQTKKLFNSLMSKAFKGELVS